MVKDVISTETGTSKFLKGIRTYKSYCVCPSPSLREAQVNSLSFLLFTISSSNPAIKNFDFTNQKYIFYFQIDGELTLGENIADNGGLREAYYGYLSYAKRNGREKYLPGLEKYTHEQLLFISFGNLWCETLTEAGSKYALEDTHCPGKFRLKGVLTNSHEFSKAFNCKKGSGMNPNQDRCIIWQKTIYLY